MTFGPLKTIYEHLYLVYDPDGNPNSGDELIFRGGPKKNEPVINAHIVIEDWVSINKSADSLDGLNPFTNRNYTELNLDGMSPEQFKQNTSDWATSFGSRDPLGLITTAIKYEVPIDLTNTGAQPKPALNSNATIKSAIESIGIDFQSNIPRDGGVGPRLPGNKFAGAESYYTASDSTVNISDTTDRSVKSVGGNNTYVVDVTQGGNHGKVLGSGLRHGR